MKPVNLLLEARRYVRYRIVTGRKYYYENTYGGVVPHGGGAFSGKDPTKVDRSAASWQRVRVFDERILLLRKVWPRNACCRLATPLDFPQPVSVMVETYGTKARISEQHLVALVRKHFDLSPRGDYQYIGFTPSHLFKNCFLRPFWSSWVFFWEKTDKAAALKKDA